MRLIRLFKWLANIKPRYILSLDEKLYDNIKKTVDYRFKTFGEHTFPVFNYKDIINNKHLLFSINPFDLVNIAVEEQITLENKKQYRIVEYMRDNHYRIVNYYSDKVLTGKEICDAPSFIEQIAPLDIYKIAYNTGFLEGRQFSKQLSLEVGKNIEKSAGFYLRLIKK